MLRKQHLIFIALSICWIHHCSIRWSVADDWNHWRGPHGDGKVVAPGYFPSQLFNLKVTWNRSIGSAYSSVSIVDQRVLTMFNDGDSDYLGSLDLETGNELWRYRIGDIYKAHDGGHDGPASTPIADQQQVFALGPRGRLVAVDAKSGVESWSVDLTKTHAAKTPFWGFATTPLIHDGMIIVQAGGTNGRGLVALDKVTGKHLWQCDVGQTEYRSPVLAKIDGRAQIIACSDSHTVGVDPANGELLWQYQGGISQDKTPLYLGDGKFLLVNRGCELIQVNGQLQSAKRLWHSAELGGSGVPSVHNGSIFGFTNRYLTCLDAETGKRIWRSRQTGGKGLIIVDGHIIVFGDRGDVVIAEASQKKYIEKSRINVSDGAAYSWPSFADQTIVVRNLKHLVALRPTHTNDADIENKVPSSLFRQFVRRVEASNNKTKLLDEFLSRYPTLPIIENEHLVHFVYRGEASDVGICGTMLDNFEQDPMTRIAGTNCFYRTYEIEPGANWAYQFIVDFDQTIPDPKNKGRTIEDNNVSELFTAAWSASGFAKTYDGSQAGRIESFQFTASKKEFSSKVQMFLPHDYAPESEHSLVIVLEGDDWIATGHLPNTLNHILEDRQTTPVVAFVQPAYIRELGGAQTQTYAEILANELRPQLVKAYNIDDAKSTTIIGKRGAAVTAVYSSLKFPEIFDQCVAISYGRADTVRADAISELIKSNLDAKPRFHITWNRYEARRPQSFSCQTQSQSLHEQLQKHGFSVTGGEDKTGFGWRSWQGQVGDALSEVLED